MSRGVFLDTMGSSPVEQPRISGTRPPARHSRRCRRSRAHDYTTHVLLECGNTVARTPLRHSSFNFGMNCSTRKCLIEPSISDCETSLGGICPRERVMPVSSITSRSPSCAARPDRRVPNDRHFQAAGSRRSLSTTNR